MPMTLFREGLEATTEVVFQLVTIVHVFDFIFEFFSQILGSERYLSIQSFEIILFLYIFSLFH